MVGAPPGHPKRQNAGRLNPAERLFKVGAVLFRDANQPARGQRRTGVGRQGIEVAHHQIGHKPQCQSPIRPAIRRNQGWRFA